MVQIDLNNNKLKLTGNLLVRNKIYDELKVRHPNAYWLRQYMEPGWDGKIKYLSDNGYAKAGLFPLVASLLDKYNEEYSIVDRRKELELGEIPLKINDFVARDYQIEAVEAIVLNTVAGIPFQRGIIGAATNAGKTLIAAMIHKTFIGMKTIILINNKTLYDQFMDDMPKLFGDDWGYINSKGIKWGDIMVCMTPTLKNRMAKVQSKLMEYRCVLFDECHLITSKTNKKVMTMLYNTVVRVGLSGTALKHKDQTKNMDVRAFFGDIVYEIKNTELIEMGHSTPIIIKIVKGNTQIKIPGNYAEEYRQGITESTERMEALYQRVEFYLRRGLHPILIVGKYHQHVENMYEYLQGELGRYYRISYIHHKVRDRKEKLDDFKTGKIDILVASLIIKLGQNMPLIRAMINAASGDSEINALQLIGRAIRKHKSKSKVYFEDFFDVGRYLMRHSKHRIKYYKQQGFKVIELYKK